jgi:hypothetical protein
VLAGCQSYNPHPVAQTDGSYIKIPDASTKAVVWGTPPEAVQSLTTSLLKRGVILVDGVKMNQMASDSRLAQPLSNGDIFKLAKIAGAKQVIFIDTDITSWQRTGIIAVFGEPPTIYTASIFIRGLDVEAGQIQWSGKAVSIDKFTNLREGIHQLTCHALATAWGMRQPGTTTAPTVCPSEQNVMVLTEPPRKQRSAANIAESN